MGFFSRLLILDWVLAIDLDQFFIGVFSNYVLPLDFVLDFGLFLLDRIFAQKSVGLHKKHVDLGGIQNF